MSANVYDIMFQSLTEHEVRFNLRLDLVAKRVQEFQSLTEHEVRFNLEYQRGSLRYRLRFNLLRSMRFVSTGNGACLSVAAADLVSISYGA